MSASWPRSMQHEQSMHEIRQSEERQEATAGGANQCYGAQNATSGQMYTVSTLLQTEACLSYLSGTFLGVAVAAAQQMEILQCADSAEAG